MRVIIDKVRLKKKLTKNKKKRTRKIYYNEPN